MINYSIIIPHYNDVESLIRCLASVPVRDDIEVLVINDGTPDEAEQLRRDIDSDSRSNLTVFANEGILRSAGSCRNTGLKYAKGRWLVFSDADDYFSDDAFDIMDVHLEDDSDIIYFRIDSINYPEMTQGTRHLYLTELLDNYQKGLISDIVLKCGWTSPCGKMIRRGLVADNSVRFDEIRYSNDVMFGIKAGFCAGKIDTDNRITYITVRKPNTLTTTQTPESFKCRFNVYIERYVYLKTNYPELTKKELNCIMHNPLYKKTLSGLKKHGLSVAFHILKLYIKNGIAPWS